MGLGKAALHCLFQLFRRRTSKFSLQSADQELDEFRPVAHVDVVELAAERDQVSGQVQRRARVVALVGHAAGGRVAEGQPRVDAGGGEPGIAFGGPAHRGYGGQVGGSPPCRKRAGLPPPMREVCPPGDN